MSKLLDALKAKQSELGKAVEVSSSTIPLNEIADRTGDDTRPLNQDHIKLLAESIALLGLIEPLVVDSQGRLLAGGHRRAAIAYLRETQPDIFEKYFAEGVPVHRLSFDAELQPDLAIQIEVAENEQRRDYTPAEVRAIADRFLEAGYQGRGRPGKGKQPIMPALAAVIGKSERTVRRYLEGENGKKRTDVLIYDQLLRRVHKDLSKWSENPSKSGEEDALEKELRSAMEAISAYLENSRRR